MNVKNWGGGNSFVRELMPEIFGLLSFSMVGVGPM